MVDTCQTLVKMNRNGNVNWCSHNQNQYENYLKKKRVELPYELSLKTLRIEPPYFIPSYLSVQVKEHL